MMNVFEAAKYKRVAEEFERLVISYWEKLPQQHHDEFFGKFKYEESKESVAIRQKIVEKLPYIEEAATMLGIGFEARSYPAPAVGGPILPVNLFRSAVDPQMGHAITDRNLISDTIIQVRSQAGKVWQEILIHSLMPWNWVIDACAFLIRIPFIILRRAGLPPKVEENIISHAIKILSIVVLLVFLAYKGVTISDEFVTKILQFLRK